MLEDGVGAFDVGLAVDEEGHSPILVADGGGLVDVCGEVLRRLCDVDGFDFCAGLLEFGFEALAVDASFADE